MYSSIHKGCIHPFIRNPFIHRECIHSQGMHKYIVGDCIKMELNLITPKHDLKFHAQINEPLSRVDPPSEMCIRVL